MPFSLYIVRVISSILSKKDKVKLYVQYIVDVFTPILIKGQKCLESVTLFFGALSPVNHRGLHQGWEQASIYLLVIPHNNYQTAKFLKIRKISLDTNIYITKHACTQTSNTIF